MDRFLINTPKRAAAFLAQIGHESEGLIYVKEIWGPTEAQKGYEGRLDLGNTHPGDGAKYPGRGLIETTGRGGAVATRDGLRACVPAIPDVPDFGQHPELLELPLWASLSAAWFFNAHGCNQLADMDSFLRMTKVINGGTNGYQDRLILWGKAKTALGVQA